MLNILAETMNYSYNVTTTSSGGSSGISPVVMIIYLAVLAAMIVALWRVFEKAGEAGWKSIVPIYNAWTLLEIVDKPGWWIFLLFIPIVDIVILVMVSLELAKRFGKSPLFGVVGLLLFPYVGYLMLGFGDAKYTGSKNTPVAN